MEHSQDIVTGKLKKCEQCGKYKRALYEINGMEICENCVRRIAFYEVFKNSFRDPTVRGDVITVGIDIGNLTWLNPFAQAWYYPLILWIFTRDTGIPFDYSLLKKSWKYRTPLEKIIKLYIEEGIFEITKNGESETIIEGSVLKDILKKYGDRADAYDIIGAWLGGLVISKLYEDTEAPDFRALRAVIKTLAEAGVDTNGNIKALPYSKVTGYSCGLCKAKFSTKDEIKKHLMSSHTVPSDEIATYMQEESVTVGYLIEFKTLLENVKKEGGAPERFVERMEKFGILVHEDPEIPRIVERDGKRYIVVHPAWIRVISRTRLYERQLIKGRTLTK
jgi:hypothetical protein